MKKHRQIDVMGIVNVTDDSFYAGSRCSGVDAVLGRVSEMLEEGASVIDFGACSTRPGALPVGDDEEWRRLEPVLTSVARSFPGARISIDTYWSSVVSRAYDIVGPFIVNDISAGGYDSGMLPLVGRLGLRYVAMHMRGTPENMQQSAIYDDVTEDVIGYFRRFAAKASDNGIKDWILDPGFGFAKTVEQNYQLLRDLSTFKTVVRADGSIPPVLVGVSRKSMIYRLLEVEPENALSATQAVHMVALQNGADILRVHDVAETVQVIKLYRTI